MDEGTSVLSLMVDLLLAFLWLTLGFVAFLWLVVVGGLFKCAAEMVLTHGRRTGRLSGFDVRFLRSMHIRR
jgi:hypothetical protein